MTRSARLPNRSLQRTLDASVGAARGSAMSILSRGNLSGRLSIGIEADPGPPQALDVTLAADIETWRPMVAASGFVVD